MSKMGWLLLLTLALFLGVELFAQTSAAGLSPAVPIQDGKEDTRDVDIDRNLPGELEPVEVRLFNERHLSFTVPESVIQALDTWFGVKVPRVRRFYNALPPPPHGAPTLPGGVRHLGVAASKRSNERSAQQSQVAGEWLVMVHKSFRSDFVSVLEDLGQHLQSRFGMRSWLDAANRARRAWREHDERVKRGERSQRFTIDVQDDDGGVLAIEMGKRMLVKVTVPPDLLHRETEVVESLQLREWTEFIEPNLFVRKTAPSIVTQNQPASPYNWGIDRIDQRDLPLNRQYSYPQGASNARIYVIDTGILISHAEFGGRAIWGNNFIDTQNTDCDGHGTHVAGIAAGATVGVAKQATVYAVKVLDCNGEGTTLAVLQGVLWATNNCGSNQCVLSLSLQGDISNALDAAVQTAYEAGLVVVTAAGNSNDDSCSYSPSRSNFAITVGSTTANDARSMFSSWGSCVDILAPGSSIRSSYIGGTTFYATISGTSQATPHVSGAAALFLARQSTKLDPAQVFGAIYASATMDRISDVDSSTPNRLLYSLANLADVPTTASGTCAVSSCTTIQGSISSAPKQDFLPDGNIVINSQQAAYGFFQGWLTATADFDLQLQFYNNTLAAWVTLVTSSGSSGVEWIQYAASPKGAGFYRWVVSAGAGETGSYTLTFQAPANWQVGHEPAGVPSSAHSPHAFWLSWLRSTHDRRALDGSKI